jgi:predicted dehydrogenase
MAKIKVGIIGAGGISSYHISGYKALGNVEIYAVCDINEQRAKDCAEKNNIKHVFADYNEMLALSELDAVSICTWNNVHASATIAALKAGKHVLCEKPMAINAIEAQQMVDAEKESGKILMVGFVRRFGNDAKILKDFIDNGMMGDIYYAKASYLRRYGFPGGWFGDRKYSGGGPLIDLGVHVIDLVRYLMGKPTAVSITGATFNKLGSRENIKGTKDYVSADNGDIFNTEDMAVAMIKFDNGAVLSVETSFSLNIKNDTANIELFGTKSGAKLDPKLEFYSELNNYLIDITPAHDTALNFNGLFESEISHFIDCISKGTKCISTSMDGLELMKIIDAVYLSAQSGKEVSL